MPVKMPEREYRAMAPLAPVGAGAEKLIESDFYVEGYATTFNDPYTLWAEYKEQVDRHALDGADVADVIFQYDHQGRVLARNRNATLVMRADEHGIKVAADLSKGESARQLYEEIVNGLVDRMSWAFTVAEEAYDYESDTRTILKVKKVYDVSAVSLPANDATEISARSWVEGVIEQEKRESQARKAKVLRLQTLL
jgi:HK97 family phage prohead protease